MAATARAEIPPDTFAQLRWSTMQRYPRTAAVSPRSLTSEERRFIRIISLDKKTEGTKAIALREGTKPRWIPLGQRRACACLRLD